MIDFVKLKTKDGRQKFYQSKEWRELRQYILLRDNYICVWCEKKDIIFPAEDIHHIVDLVKNPYLALESSNLISLCHKCHSEHTSKHIDYTEPKVINLKWKI